MAVDLLYERLPSPWNYAVTDDGRVFFINEESRSTTWLHPVKLHPVQSGHFSAPDLPRSMEKAVTPEGAPYFIDHVNLRTTFHHPVTGQTAAVNIHPADRQYIPTTPESLSPTSPRANMEPKRQSLKKKKNKVITREPSAKRSHQAPVSAKGWLHLRENSGLKNWKRRWFVLAEFCLYYYKGQEEGSHIGSILLPSYKINPCSREDGISKKLSFKAEHENMKTYYFAAESREEMTRWMNAMSLASILQRDPNMEQEYNNNYPYMKDAEEAGFQNSPRGQHQIAPDQGYGSTDARSPTAHTDPWGQGHQFDRGREPLRETNGQSPRQPEQGWYDSENENGYDVPSSLWRNMPVEGHHPPQGHLATGEQPTQGDYGSPYSNQDSQNISGLSDSYRYDRQKVVVMDTAQLSNANRHTPQQHNQSLQKWNNAVQDLSGLSDMGQHERGSPIDSNQRGSFVDNRGSYINDRGSYSDQRGSQADPRGSYADQRGSQADPRGSYADQRGYYVDHRGLQADHRGSYADQRGSYSDQRGSQVYPRESYVDQRGSQADSRGSYAEQKGSYADQRGSQTDPRGSYADQRGSQADPRGSQADPRGSQADPRGSYADPRGSQADPRGSYADPRGSQADPRGSYADQRGSQADPRGSYADQRGSQADPRGSYADQRGSQADPRGSYADQRGSQVDPRGSYVDQRGSQADSRGSYADQRGSQADQRGSYADQRGSQADPRGSYADQRGSQADPRGSYADQRGSQADPRGSYADLRGVNIGQRGSRPQEISHHGSYIETPGSYPGSHQGSFADIHQRAPLPDTMGPKSRSKDSLLNPEKHSYRGSPRASQRSSVASESRLAADRGYTRTHGQPGGPIYENLERDNDNIPQRPPLPAMYRNQLVQEIAEARTPHTREDMLTAAEMETHRQGEPFVFQYPDSPQKRSSDHSNMNQVYPETYLQAKREAEEAEPQMEQPPRWEGEQYREQPEYPATYWQAKDKDNKRQSGGSDKWEPMYSTIPALDPSYHAKQVAPVSPALGRHQRELKHASDFDIHTIKEDPSMSDNDVLTTKKLQMLESHLNGNRLRLSISAADLVGKSHEELVLLLIQLRRSQSRLEDVRNWYRGQMDVSRDYEREYKKKRESSLGELELSLEQEHDHFMTLRKQTGTLEKQLEVNKPLVNLVDNLVTMGSLYGGNNTLLHSEYKRHKLQPGEYTEPKKMIAFSRQHQEDKLSREQEEGIKQLTEDEVDLEEKLQQLYELDRQLQDQSFAVTSLQEDRELLEKALQGIKEQEDQEDDHRQLDRLTQQRLTVDRELTKVRQQLADAFKLLEEKSVENGKVENEVILLRKKIARGLSRSTSSPTLSSENARTKMKLEREVHSIQNLMEGLSKQGEKISQVMKSLRYSNPDLTEDDSLPPHTRPHTRPWTDTARTSTYAETDIDTMQTRDLATNQAMDIFKKSSSMSSLPRPMSHVPPQPAVTSNTPYQPPHDMPVPSRQQAKHLNGHHGQPEHYQPQFSHRREESLDGGDSMYYDEEDDSLTPRDISDADDNTKRFYGLVPREHPKVKTVRDIKKRENERKGHKDKSRRYVNGDVGDSSSHDSSFGSDWNSPHDAGIIRKSQSLPRNMGAPNTNTSLNSTYSSDILRHKPPHDPATKKTIRVSAEDKRRSATERLFPSGQKPTPVVADLMSKDRVRRLSDLVSPRPFSMSTSNKTASIRPVSAFTRPDTQKHDSELFTRPDAIIRPKSADFTRASPTSVATVRPVQNPPGGSTPNTATVRPMSASDDAFSSQIIESWGTPQRKDKDDNKHRNRRQSPGGRYRTISSSQPVKLEPSIFRRDRIHTVAGDLITSRSQDSPELVKSELNKDTNFDDLTIDREVLFMPDKVEIPERYIPDSDDEVTEEEKVVRAEKADRIRKMLAAHSLQEWSRNELDLASNPAIHKKVQQEKRRREQLLDIRQALAKEVTQKSREVAEKRRLAKSMESLNLSGDHKASLSPNLPRRSFLS